MQSFAQWMAENVQTNQSLFQTHGWKPVHDYYLHPDGHIGTAQDDQWTITPKNGTTIGSHTGHNLQQTLIKPLSIGISGTGMGASSLGAEPGVAR